MFPDLLRIWLFWSSGLYGPHLRWIHLILSAYAHKIVFLIFFTVIFPAYTLKHACYVILIILPAVLNLGKLKTWTFDCSSSDSDAPKKKHLKDIKSFSYVNSIYNPIWILYFQECTDLIKLYSILRLQLKLLYAFQNITSIKHWKCSVNNMERMLTSHHYEQLEQLILIDKILQTLKKMQLWLFVWCMTCLNQIIPWLKIAKSY